MQFLNSIFKKEKPRIKIVFCGFATTDFWLVGELGVLPH